MNTKSMDAQNADTHSSLRPVEKPIAWIGNDRLLLDDVSKYGLHRYVVARREYPPDVELYVEQIGRKARYHESWLIQREDYWFLWIVWKEIL